MYIPIRSYLRPPSSQNRYPDLQRTSTFSRLTPSDLTFFRAALGPDADASILSDPEDLIPFNSDWMHKYTGQTSLVLRPSTPHQLSQILSHCNARKLAVVPQGGNTGLVGGSVPVFDEIVISTQRMNSIRSFDPITGVLIVDAGVVLETADSFLKEKGYIFPLDLGAKGSCHIGGNVSTNAGGLRLLRYGSLHGSVLGVEAVLPDGTVVDDLSALRKNNTGYDLKQLFIGAEGTLGIVTAVSVLCPMRSQAVNVAYLGLGTFEAALEAFVAAKRQLGEILSAFEFMDGRTQKIVKDAKKREKGVLEGEHEFYCLIETSGSNQDADYERMEAFLAGLMEKGIIEDGTVAQDETQIKDLWTWREGITENLGQWGGVYKYDFSIPLPKFYKMVEDTREHLTKAGLVGDTDEYPVVDVMGYGHMGDGNLHLNVPTRGFNKKVENALEPFVYEMVKAEKGSISAEHGLGFAKKPFIGYSRSDSMISLMKRVKSVFDPVSSPTEPNTH
jgi:(R)-2-hydroxyglutarate---pyruvate transhydrogenase